jgi:hypothetical protein
MRWAEAGRIMNSAARKAARGRKNLLRFAIAIFP